jgi:hypothetical protein
MTKEAIKGEIMKKTEIYSINTLEAIASALQENPEEECFGTESFGWITIQDEQSDECPDEGYIYPCRGGYGNMGTYHSRDELMEVLREHANVPFNGDHYKVTVPRGLSLTEGNILHMAEKARSVEHAVSLHSFEYNLFNNIIVELKKID